MSERLTNKDFAFIYSPHLAAFIEQRGIKPITVAINPRNMNKFAMFTDDGELQEIIDDYRKLK